MPCPTSDGSASAIIKEVLPSATPIVLSLVTYPADAGLIESFAYSGNNLAGSSNYVPLLTHAPFLQTMLPTAKSQAIFPRQGESNSTIQAANVIRLLQKASNNSPPPRIGTMHPSAP